MVCEFVTHKDGLYKISFSLLCCMIANEWVGNALLQGLGWPFWYSSCHAHYLGIKSSRILYLKSKQKSKKQKQQPPCFQKSLEAQLSLLVYQQVHFKCAYFTLYFSPLLSILYSYGHGRSSLYQNCQFSNKKLSACNTFPVQICQCAFSWYASHAFFHQSFIVRRRWKERIILFKQ